MLTDKSLLSGSTPMQVLSLLKDGDKYACIPFREQFPRDSRGNGFDAPWTIYGRNI